MNFSTFALNLLRMLDGMQREQNVARAADRLALSQTTVITGGAYRQAAGWWLPLVDLPLTSARSI
jgi:hypothetical protein